MLQGVGNQLEVIWRYYRNGRILSFVNRIIEYGLYKELSKGSVDQGKGIWRRNTAKEKSGG